MVSRLVDVTPVVPADQLVAQMVPPSMFDDVSFDSYIPDPAQPSQAAAVKACREFAETVAARRAPKKGLFGRRPKVVQGTGIYLDGGFGVGKTHLLTSIYHNSPEPKAFGTFVELTHVVGALGFNRAVEELSGHSVLCIDEFELDDPGDTMLVSRLLAELTTAGVSVAATSNTLPEQLGEGRFAAKDFMREIRKMSGIFESIRVDGPDYRHRNLPPAPEPMSDEALVADAEAVPGATLDDFDELCKHLATLHRAVQQRLGAPGGMGTGQQRAGQRAQAVFVGQVQTGGIESRLAGAVQIHAHVYAGFGGVALHFGGAGGGGLGGD